MTIRSEDSFYNAEGGEPVTRGHGYSARIICRDRKAHSSNPQKTMVALVRDSDGTEVARTYFANGRFDEKEKHELDLVNMTLHRTVVFTYRSSRDDTILVTSELKPLKDKIWRQIGSKEIELEVML